MKPQLTIEAFADWCASRPADEVYDWGSECNCAAAQYARHLGMTDAFSERYTTKAGFGSFWAKAESVALRDDFWRTGMADTFGALAKRLLASRLRRSAS